MISRIRRFGICLGLSLLSACLPTQQVVHHFQGLRVEFPPPKGWDVRVPAAASRPYELAFVPDTLRPGVISANLLLVVSPKSTDGTGPASAADLVANQEIEPGVELLPETGMLTWDNHDFLLTSRVVHRAGGPDLLQRAYHTEIGPCLVSFIATRPGNEVALEAEFRLLMRTIHISPE